MCLEHRRCLVLPFHLRSCFTVCLTLLCISPLSLRPGVAGVCSGVPLCELLCLVGLCHVISVLAGGIPGFRMVLCCFAHSQAPAEDHTSKLKEYGNSVCTSDARVIACTTRYPTTSTLIVRREAEREGAKQIKRTETNSNQQTHTTKRATDRHKQQEKEHSGMQRPRRGTRYIHKLAGKCRSLSK